MVKACFVAVLIACLQQALCDTDFENYVLHERTIDNKLYVNSMRECRKSCTGLCTAVSYNSALKLCLQTYCGHRVLSADEAYNTITVNRTVMAGVELPYATHEFPLTDRCGLSSYGLNMESSLINNGASLRTNGSQLSSLHGKGVYFTGVNTGQYFLRNAYDPSLGMYNSADKSLSAAFYVKFDKVPTSACLLEFSGSWHFWLWPNGASIYYNAVTTSASQSYSIAYNVTANVWYHFAFVYDARAATMAIYVDGVLVSTSYLQYADKAAFKTMSIGGRIGDSNIGFFQGSYYCLSLYDEPLKPFHVLTHKAACTEGQTRLIPKETTA